MQLQELLSNTSQKEVKVPKQFGQLCTHMSEELHEMVELSTWVKGFPEPLTMDMDVLGRCAGIMRIIMYLEVFEASIDEQPQLAANAMAQAKALKPAPSPIPQSEWVVAKIADLAKGQTVAKPKAKGRSAPNKDCLLVQQLVMNTLKIFLKLCWLVFSHLSPALPPIVTVTKGQREKGKG